MCLIYNISEIFNEIKEIIPNKIKIYKFMCKYQDLLIGEIKFIIYNYGYFLSDFDCMSIGITDEYKNDDFMKRAYVYLNKILMYCQTIKIINLSKRSRIIYRTLKGNESAIRDIKIAFYVLFYFRLQFEDFHLFISNKIYGIKECYYLKDF